MVFDTQLAILLLGNQIELRLIFSNQLPLLFLTFSEGELSFLVFYLPP
jgi:hypothetical protein